MAYERPTKHNLRIYDLHNETWRSEQIFVYSSIIKKETNHENKHNTQTTYT